MDKNPSVRHAINELGGVTAAAKILGAKNYQNVQQWIAAGRVPAKYVPAIAARTRFKHRDLRPEDWFDIWPELLEEEPAHA